MIAAMVARTKQLLDKRLQQDQVPQDQPPQRRCPACNRVNPETWCPACRCHMPDESEIYESACLLIQADWSAAERNKRSQLRNPPVEIPLVIGDPSHKDSWSMGVAGSDELKCSDGDGGCEGGER